MTSFLLLALLTGAPGPVELVVAPPGCFDRSWTRLRLPKVLEERAAQAGARATPSDVSLQGLSLDGRWLIPIPPFGAAPPMQQFLDGARRDGVERTVLGSVDAQQTSWEVALTLPGPGAEKVRALLSDRGQAERFEVLKLKAGGVEVYAFESAEAPATFPFELARWFRVPVALETLEDGGAKVEVFAAGKRIGPRARLLRELTEVRVGREVGLLHPGELDALQGPDRARCIADLRAQDVSALAVRAGLLASSPKELLALELPLTSANLFAADGSRPFPGWRLVTVGNTRVAMVSVTEPSDLTGLTAAQRERWFIESPRAGVERALEDIQDADPPIDLVIGIGVPALLVDDGQSGSGRGLDVIVGGHVLADLTKRVERVSVDPETRNLDAGQPVLIARPSTAGLALLTAELGARGLSAVRFESVPVRQEGKRIAYDGTPLDPYFARIPLRSHVVVPDVDPVVRASEELSALTFGEDVLHRARRHRLSPAHRARMTDAVWMRLVTNALRDQTGAEVALARNSERSIDVRGPLTQGIIRTWVPEHDVVDVVLVPGRTMVELAKLMTLTSADPRFPPTDLLFAAGFDANKGFIEGRRIDPDQPYRVALTRAARAFPPVSRWLGPPPPGPGVPVVNLVLAQLEKEIPDPSAESAAAGLSTLLRNSGGERRGRWSLRLEELSATGAATQSSPGLERFAQSRETRATSPNFFSLGLRADAATLFDGSLLAWENRLRLRLARFAILLPGFPPNEQEDDVLVFTEARLQNLPPAFLHRFAQLSPFARLAVDSELTPTPDLLSPGDVLPHQLLLRQSTGLAIAPARGWIREVRGGIVLQADGSELTSGPLELGDVHLDVGVLVGVKVMIPISVFRFVSDTQARYLLPDPDDRRLDVGLRLNSFNRVEVNLPNGLATFLFVDILAMTPKDFVTLPAANVLTGVGLRFHSIYKL